MKSKKIKSQDIDVKKQFEKTKVYESEEIKKIQNIMNEEVKDIIRNDQMDNEKDPNTKQCLVCIEEIKEECILNPCQHVYCYTCIVDWMKQKQRCPLCNSEVKELLRNNSSLDSNLKITKVSEIAEKVAIEKSQSSSESENEIIEQFECLDHNYLKNEVDKLIYKLEFVQTKMEQNSSKYDDFQWFVSEHIDDQIYDLEMIVEEFRQFNPSEIASKCIMLEEHLDALRNNKWESIEEYYSDLYALELQKEEQDMVNYQYDSKKNGNQNKTNQCQKGSSNTKNGKKSSNHYTNDFDDYYNMSNFDDEANYSIKNVKPKAPKKKFNTTAPSNSHLKM